MAVKFNKCDEKAFLIKDIIALGYNMLERADIGEVFDNEGNIPQMKTWILGDCYDENALRCISKQKYLKNHIDIFAGSAKFIFDIGRTMKVGKAFLSSFFNSKTNFSIAEFKLYASDDKATLFDDCNMVAHERGIDTWKPGGRNNADWLYEVDGSFRYFGIYVIKANAVDDIIRFENVGLYSDEYSHSCLFCSENYDPNVFDCKDFPQLTDDYLFDTEDAVKVTGEKTFRFDIENTERLSKIIVITDKEAEISCREFKDAEISVKTIDCGRYEYIITCDGVFTNNAEVTVKGDGVYVEQVLGSSSLYSVDVDFSDVICEDNMAVGANVLPMSLMEESVATGYNEAYWELEKCRILKAKPHVVRFWFQPDWIVDTYENYKNGNFNFDTEKMYSVYKHLDAFMESGTEVEFNFGWKVGNKIQEWFSFPEVAMPRNSAPREADLFAKCCAATLKELIYNRGYSNIKYLTFYNEPDYGGERRREVGDFCLTGSDYGIEEYWEILIRATLKEMENAGIKDCVKVWGCEISGNNSHQSEWADYIVSHCKDIFSAITSHKYHSDTETFAEYAKMYNSHRGGLPVVISECGQADEPGELRWDYNEIQFFIEAANAGFAGMLIWCLNGIVITEPLEITMRNPYDLWDCPQMTGGIDNVRHNFYQLAPIMNYVPNHSKTVKSTPIYNSDCIRSAVFQRDDDIAVLVELKGGVSEKELKVNFGKAINKKLYKYVYKRPTRRDGNAIMAPCCGTLTATDILCDTLTGDYQLVIYSTTPPQTQVDCGSIERYVAAGESEPLCASVIDGTGEVTYSVAAATSDVFTLSDNKICVSPNAKSGDMCAVKAENKTGKNAYGIVIIKVK